MDFTNMTCIMAILYQIPMNKCIKKCFLLIALCSLSVTLFSQESFFRFFPTPDYEMAMSAVQTPDGNFILTGKKSVSSMDDLQGYILKLSQDGTILDDYTFQSKTRTSIFSIIDAYPNEENQYLIIGNIDSVAGADRYSTQVFYRINDSLHILEQHLFPAEVNHKNGSWQTEIVDDSLLFLLGSYFDYTQGSNPMQKLSVSKFLFPLDSVATYHVEAQANTLCIAQDLIYLKNTHKLNVLYFGNTIDRLGALKILELNDSLQYLRSFSGPERIYSNTCAVKYNDTSYLITGMGDGLAYPPNQHVISYLMNQNNDTLKRLEYYNHPDTILYTGAGTNTMINGLSVFITGIYNINPSQFPFQTTPMWIQITRTDLDMNIISHHFYGGDAVYMPYKIISTSDGGAFITGYRSIFTPPADIQYDIFVLKVDANGVITDVPENATWQASEAILSPNPGSEYCMAIVGAQYTKSRLVLYDLKGQVVIDLELFQPATRINTALLDPGTYVYQFFSDQQLIGRGKWIKQ